jgi:hypothetical protein
VEALYQNSGSSVIELEPSNPNTAILVFQGGQGLYGIFSPDRPTTVVGVVLDREGAPIEGALVETVDELMEITGPDGTFSIPDVSAILGDIIVTVSTTIDGKDVRGISMAVHPVPGGITDVGTILVPLVYLEVDGQIVGEAELFSMRTSDANGNQWLIVPNEATGAGSFIANARGGKYIQSLPDNSSGGGPLIAPSIEYQMRINTPGTYRLFVRWDGNSSNRNNSDSLFADIVELKDGPGGTIADWYELVEFVDGNFGIRPWDGGGGFEQNQTSSSNSPMTWVISTPGIYTLRFSQREDGSAVDAFVFQLSSLPAPSGNGPPVSPFAE